MTASGSDEGLLLLLALLADGEVHSGQSLGAVLGVSRAAVWKQLQKLDALGLRVLPVKGQGYRLEAPLELLDGERICADLPPAVRALLSGVVIAPVVDSTNARALAGEPGWAWLAEQQTAGRGRRGRTWISPFGRNIYLSLRWRFEGGAAALEGLSLAVGVAVVEALASCGLVGGQLKWPNDILVDGRKLGGILLEMSGDPAGTCELVVGVGVNVNLSEAAAEAIDQPWTDLTQLGLQVSRNQLAGALLRQLLPLLDGFADSGFAPYRTRWEALDAFRGAPVQVLSASQCIEGVAAGVDASGALRLQVGDNIRLFHGGELSLRPVR